MDVRRRSMVLGVILVAVLSRVLSAQAAAESKASLTPEQMEAFLLKARVSNQRDAGGFCQRYPG